MSLCANNLASNNVVNNSVVNNNNRINFFRDKILFVFSLVNVNTQVVKIDVDNYCNFYELFGSVVSASELSIVHTFFVNGDVINPALHCTRGKILNVSGYNYVVYLTN